MPFKSEAQRRWAHANAGKAGGMSKKEVDEFERATGKKKLPLKAPKGKKKTKKGKKK